jgi:flagellar hook-basal body complex protein FliE
MITSPQSAASAYANIGRIAAGTGTAGGGAGAAREGGDFASLVRNAVSSVADSARGAEAKAQGFAAGRVDLVDVVTAIAETEVAIETMVSVRDRVIQSYEEIMRMPI